MTGLLKVRERSSEGQRCAYCREALDDQAVPCPDCATALHAECWWELRACPTIGCKRDADFVERPRRYRDPQTDTPEEEPGGRFKIFRAPRLEGESVAGESSPATIFGLLALLCFLAVPMGISADFRGSALLAFFAGMGAVLVTVVVWTRRR